MYVHIDINGYFYLTKIAYRCNACVIPGGIAGLIDLLRFFIQIIGRFRCDRSIVGGVGRGEHLTDKKTSAKVVCFTV